MSWAFHWSPPGYYVEMQGPLCQVGLFNKFVLMTIYLQTCAKLKNACQTCILDLEYGLPIQVRDSVLKVKDDLPKSDVNREYYLQQVGENTNQI